jgi:hypothetical protein
MWFSEKDEAQYTLWEDMLDSRATAEHLEKCLEELNEEITAQWKQLAAMWEER